MVRSGAKTVDGYLGELSEERRATVEAVREVVVDNLPAGFEEALEWGMIGYVIPLERYPDIYNDSPLMLAAIAAQKRHYSVYLHAIYADPALRAEFEERYRESGKRMDIGKSCVRFRALDDLPLGLIGWAIASIGVDDFIAAYEASRGR